MSRPSTAPSIDLYTAGTPNGHKVTIALEELELPYTLHALNLRDGESKTPAFRQINPNGKIPALVDHEGPEPITVFESGAILIYLAEKTGKLLAPSGQARADALAWLMFQMSAIGPIFGQTYYFMVGAPEKIPLAIERFKSETARIVDVLDERLATNTYLAGAEYTIADIASYDWVSAGAKFLQFGEGKPHLQRWLALVGGRPAVQRGVKIPG